MPPVSLSIMEKKRGVREWIKEGNSAEKIVRLSNGGELEMGRREEPKMDHEG